MLIKQIPLRNSLRNYMYLLVCEQTHEALAIDPLDHAQCLSVADEQGWEITKVLNTHHHHDHIGGNGPVIAATDARLYAHHAVGDKIPGVDVGLQANDVVSIGEASLLVMDTPGHTMSDICLYYAGDDNNLPALFSGYILFNAGAGNCHNGGSVEILYTTFAEQLSILADNVRIFPGHDYIENNLRFALDREPGNAMAEQLLQQFSEGLDAESFVTDMALERQINVFLRLENQTVISRLQEQQQLASTDPQAVFAALRALRNHW